jgi:hypothetical protein
VLLYASCNGTWCGAIRCLLSSDTIFIEEAIVAEFARRRYILTHLLLAAVSTFASELQWIRLQVSDDAAHAAAAYTGLGMTDPPAEQWAEAGWHPRVDGPASCRHRILYAPVAQLRAAAAERTAGTPPPEMAVVALGCADAGVTALDVRSARAAADAALLAMRKATAESTRLWRLECDRLRSGDTVDPAHVRRTKAVFDRARQASLAYSDAVDSLAIVERMAVAAGGEAAAATASDGVATATSGGDGDLALASQADEAAVGGRARGDGGGPAGGAGGGAAMAMQGDEAMMGGGASGGGDEPAGSSSDGAAVAMQIDEAMAGGSSGDGAAADEAAAGGGAAGEGGGGAGGPIRQPRRRAALLSRAARRAMRATRAREGEPGGGS